MKLDPKLVCNIENQSIFESSLNGTKARGSYNTMKFAMNLRVDIRKAMDTEENPYEKTQAFSTFLHETIHWWQHMGSNFGFIYSLSYPAMAAVSTPYLRKLIKKNITVKPLTKFNKQNNENHNKLEISELNKVLNTYYDIKYAKLFALDNKNITEITKDKIFFVSTGNCYHTLWHSSILSLTTVDTNYKFLPDVNK